MNTNEPDQPARDKPNDDDEKAPDVQSDPARNDEDGSDWATEGGATPEGPATDTDADDDTDE